MAWTNLVSTDPRKRAAQDALRAAQRVPSGKGRVTCVMINEARGEIRGYVHAHPGGSAGIWNTLTTWQPAPPDIIGQQIADAYVSVEALERTHEGRTVYRWTVAFAEGTDTGRDFHSGVGGGTAAEGFTSLLSFLSAAAEAVETEQRTGRRSDNAGLFPPRTCAWAAAHQDAIAALADDLLGGGA